MIHDIDNFINSETRWHSLWQRRTTQPSARGNKNSRPRASCPTGRIQWSEIAKVTAANIHSPVDCFWYELGCALLYSVFIQTRVSYSQLFPPSSFPPPSLVSALNILKTHSSSHAHQSTSNPSSQKRDQNRGKGPRDSNSEEDDLILVTLLGPQILGRERMYADIGWWERARNMAVIQEL
jgi:hypothetical protein